MKPFPYAIWLMPRAEESLVLEKAICALSARFGTPSFASHATLCSGVWNMETSRLLDTVNRLTEILTSTEVQTTGVDWSDHWSTFFFLRLCDGSGLFPAEIFLPQGSHRPEMGPHISLMYCFDLVGLDRETLRTALAAQMLSTVRFDSLALVRPSTGRWEDVGSWEILHLVGLSG